MKFAERKHQKPKAQATAKRRRDPDRNTNGRFVRGNKAATASKQNHLTHGLAGADRLAKDVALHGSRSRALDRLVSDNQAWATALREWRSTLIDSLGGSDAFTPEAHELLAMVMIGKIIVDSIGSYCVKTNLVNKRSRKVYPVVEAWDRLATSQTNRLKLLRDMVTQAQREREPSLDDLLSGDE
jgi:hypothetical protein